MMSPGCYAPNTLRPKPRTLNKGDGPSHKHSRQSETSCRLGCTYTRSALTRPELNGCTYARSALTRPELNQAARDIVSTMLDKNPRRRISAADALEHAWMRGIWVCGVEGRASALTRTLTPTFRVSADVV